MLKNEAFSHQPCSLRKRLLIGFLGALAFIVICIPCLTAQGSYYDELYQVPASFAYKGINPQMCCISYHGIPVLNMIYEGALKSTIYGLYLKATGASFTIVSWRLLGIIISALGIFLFSLIVPQSFSLKALILFLFFLETDVTVILGSRHDYGPMAFALLFRLLFIALWIRGELAVNHSEYNSMLLGVIAGISLFEKLTSSLFLAAVALMLLDRFRKSGIRHFFFAAGGTVLGALPVAFLMLFKFHNYRAWLSVSEKHHILSMAGFLEHLRDYLSMGGGFQLKTFILGVSQGWNSLEWVPMGILLLGAGAVALYYHRENKAFHLAGMVLLAYGAVGILTYLLQLPLGIHHFIIGTPLQYTAIMLCYSGLSSLPSKERLIARAISCGFLGILLMTMVLRVAGLISLERSLFNRDASLTWDHSLTDLGNYAACKKDDAFFVAADWGVATQIYCISQGNPELVSEPFWNYGGIEDLNRIIIKSGKSTFYLVTKYPLSRVKEHNTLQILDDAGKLQGWRELPPEQEIAAMKAIRVRKFTKTEK
jgi:hypothetical protein